MSSSDPDNRALYFDILKDLRKAFSHKVCLAPNAMKSKCVGQIIAAHSIQRNGCGLNRIAENGHVLSPAPQPDGTAAMVRVGINKASTFTGFCGYHDTQIFAPIETDPLTFTDQQVFLLLYRAFCKEYFAKIGANEHAQKMLARGLPGHRHVEGFAAGVDMGLFELQRCKQAMDTMLLASDWSRLRHVIYDTDHAPEFCTSAWLSINYGFHGQVIQNIGDLFTPLHGTMFTIVPMETGGRVIFAWIDDHKSATRFTRSLERVPVGDLPEHLLHFTFEYAENVFCRPTWWQSLREDAQDSLARHFLSGTTPRSPRGRHWLILSPRITPGWRIVNERRKTAL